MRPAPCCARRTRRKPKLSSTRIAISRPTRSHGPGPRRSAAPRPRATVTFGSRRRSTPPTASLSPFSNVRPLLSFRSPSVVRESGIHEHRPRKYGFRARRCTAPRNDVRLGIAMTDRILILDFGSQVTQLIARRVRENGVYCEIQPYTVTEEKIRAFDPRGIILSGGPASVTVATTPRAPDIVFSLGVPVLAICYGMQTTCAQLGGRVTLSDHQEFGRAFIDVIGECQLFDELWPKGAREQVWMSHGDKVDALPPGFRAVASSDGAPFAAIADDERHIYGVLFHPEVVHTPQGGRLLGNFARLVCGLAGDWTMAAFRADSVARIRERVGSGRVICGLSGGVDSAVAAALLHEAIG